MFRKKEKKSMTARTHRCKFQVTLLHAKEGQDLRCAAVHTTSW